MVPASDLCRAGVAWLVLAATCAAPVAAEELTEAPEIIVFGRAIDIIGIASAGSSGVVGYQDVDLRPIHGTLRHESIGAVGLYRSVAAAQSRTVREDQAKQFSIAVDAVVPIVLASSVTWNITDALAATPRLRHFGAAALIEG